MQCKIVLINCKINKHHLSIVAFVTTSSGPHLSVDGVRRRTVARRSDGVAGRSDGRPVVVIGLCLLSGELWQCKNILQLV